MTVNELVAAVEAVEVVTDEAGNKKVILDWAVWEEMVALIEEIEAEQRWESLFARSPDFLAELAAEAQADRQAERVEPLDPDTL